jgi:fatty acid desaturase
LAILSGRGRDCTALFESYHPWNDRHRKVLEAYGAKLPPADPFYEELKKRVREAFPNGKNETKMPWSHLIPLLLLWCAMMALFFGVRTPLACAAAGVLMGTVGTRLAHEGAHYQVSKRPWVNRLMLFIGYFLTGPSMTWHYRHVISHHSHTNQEEDIDVRAVGIADKLPVWLRMLVLPVLPIGAMMEIGLNSCFEILVLRSFNGHAVDWSLGWILPETLLWMAVHWCAGPPLLSYVAMYLTAGAIFVPCSQVAHAIIFPGEKKYASWAQMQIEESVDFATDSTLWFNVAFGLTTQVEHHLFPSIGHHYYDRIRKIVAKTSKEHGVGYRDISAGAAFYALWQRWLKGQPVPLA